MDRLLSSLTREGKSGRRSSWSPSGKSDPRKISSSPNLIEGAITPKEESTKGVTNAVDSALGSGAPIARARSDSLSEVEAVTSPSRLLLRRASVHLTKVVPDEDKDKDATERATSFFSQSGSSGSLSEKNVLSSLSGKPILDRERKIDASAHDHLAAGAPKGFLAERRFKLRVFEYLVRKEEVRVWLESVLELPVDANLATTLHDGKLLSLLGTIITEHNQSYMKNRSSGKFTRTVKRSVNGDDVPPPILDADTEAPPRSPFKSRKNSSASTDVDLGSGSIGRRSRSRSAASSPANARRRFSTWNTFQRLDLVSGFITAASVSLCLKDDVMFAPPDLVEQRNVPQVVAALRNVAIECASKYADMKDVFKEISVADALMWQERYEDDVADAVGDVAAVSTDDDGGGRDARGGASAGDDETGGVVKLQLMSTHGEGGAAVSHHQTRRVFSTEERAHASKELEAADLNKRERARQDTSKTEDDLAQDIAQLQRSVREHEEEMMGVQEECASRVQRVRLRHKEAEALLKKSLVEAQREAQREAKGYAAKNELLQSELDETRQEAEAVERRAREEIEQQQKRSLTMDRKFEELKGELEESKLRAAAVERAFEESKASVTGAKRDLEESNARTKAVESEFEEFITSVEVMKREHERRVVAVEKELAARVGKEEEGEIDLKELRAEVISLLQRCEEAEESRKQEAELRSKAEDSLAAANKDRQQEEAARKVAQNELATSEEGRLGEASAKEKLQDELVVAQEARLTADRERMVAEEARRGAEEERAVATQEKMTAEAEMRKAQDELAAAEEARKAADEGRTCADEAKSVAVKEREVATEASATAEAGRVEAEREREEAQEEVEALKKAIVTAEEERDVAEQEKQDAEQARKDGLEVLAEAEKGRRNAETVMEEAEEERRVAEGRRQEAEEERTDALEEKRVAEEARVAAEKRTRDAEAEVERLNREISARQEEIVILGSGRDEAEKELAERLSASTATVVELRETGRQSVEQAERLEEEKAAVEMRLAAATSELEGLKTDVSLLTETVRQKGEASDLVNVALREREEEVVVLMGELRTSEGVEEGLNERLSTAQDEIDTLKRCVVKEEEERAVMVRRETELEEKLEELMKRLRRVEELLKEKEEERMGMRTELEKWKTQAARGEMSVDETRRAAEKDTAKMAKEVDDLKQALFVCLVLGLKLSCSWRGHINNYNTQELFETAKTKPWREWNTWLQDIFDGSLFEIRHEVNASKPAAPSPAVKRKTMKDQSWRVATTAYSASGGPPP